MTIVLDAALRSSVPIVAALLACVLLRRRSAALRHSVLTSALFAAVAVIPLAFVLPPWRVAVPDIPVATPRSPGAAGSPGAAVAVAGDVAIASRAAVLPIADADTGATQPPTAARFASGINARQSALIIWMAGVAVAAGMLLLGVARLLRLALAAEALDDGRWQRLTVRIAREYGIGRSIVLLTTRAPGVVATWGLFRPRVLLPANAAGWPDDRVRVVLCHELAHVRRCDWAIQVAADVFRAVFWFNPFVWMLCARLRREAEQACDDAVLGSGMAAVTYASQLVDIAKDCRRAPKSVPAMSIARPSTLEGRITAMLNNRLDRRVPTRLMMAFIVIVLAALVLPSAAVDLSAQAPAATTLTGYAYDNTGGVLPGVEVTLAAGQQDRRSAVSDGSGRFAFPGVGPGRFVLEASQPGFRTVRSEFVLAAPRDWTRNITMQVSELEETVTVTAKRPAQAVPLPQGASRTNPVRVGGVIRQPRKTKDVPPVYPAAMRDAGLEGIVPMEALIRQDGSVASVRTLSAEVHPAFARAAEEAVRQWTFTPTTLNGQPVDVQMTVSVRFSLED